MPVEPDGMVRYWRGKPLEKLSREELIEAVKCLGRWFSLETTREMARIKALGHVEALRRGLR
jgi:hypothetical protein